MGRLSAHERNIRQATIIDKRGISFAPQERKSRMSVVDKNE